LRGVVPDKALLEIHAYRERFQLAPGSTFVFQLQRGYLTQWGPLDYSLAELIEEDSVQYDFNAEMIGCGEIFLGDWFTRGIQAHIPIRWLSGVSLQPQRGPKKAP
jgi:hypothetical protein